MKKDIKKEVYMIWKDGSGWSDGRDLPGFKGDGLQGGKVWMKAGVLKAHITRVVKRNGTVYEAAEIITFQPKRRELLTDQVIKLRVALRL